VKTTLAKNKPADISTGYIVKKMAKTTTLTVDQIHEAVNLYTGFISQYLRSDICPDDVRITIPNLGKISFKKKKGLKAGSTYKSPLDFGLTKDENGKAIMIDKTVEEDQPDYLRVWFDASPTLQKDVRSASEKRWRKKNGK
jgi:hypothetical protein